MSLKQLNIIASLAVDSKMNNYRTKLELLQSNANRVANQHDSLQKLMSDINLIVKVQFVIHEISGVKGKYERLKENICNELAKAGLSYGNDKTFHFDDGEGQLREIQSQLNKLRLSLSKSRQQQNLALKYQAKKNEKEKQAQMQEMHRKNIGEIEKQRKNNLKKYLSSEKEQIIQRNKKKVTNLLKSYLQEYGESIENDIEADIGNLISQMQFEEYLASQSQIESKIQSNLSDSEPMNEESLKRDVFNAQEFVKTFYRRIQHETNIFNQRIDNAIQCIKDRLNKKVKNMGISRKYGQEHKNLNSCIEKLERELRGAKMKIKHEQNYKKHLDLKVESWEKYQQQQHEGILKAEQKLQQCRNKLQQFNQWHFKFMSNN